MKIQLGLKGALVSVVVLGVAAMAVYASPEAVRYLKIKGM